MMHHTGPSAAVPESPFAPSKDEEFSEGAGLEHGLAHGRRGTAVSGVVYLPPRGYSGTRAVTTSNPQRMGLPKRDASLRESVDVKCRELGGVKPIHSVLVANNGIAAVKFIRSIRSWAYKTFGSELAVVLVAMATPEDMQNDAEHVRMADQFVEVPGGSNNNNYANVPLIAQVAERANVDAVWPGWGHASENPDLPGTLEEIPSGPCFLGPPKGPMASLGDKIGSSILAQTANVPCIPWSGSKVVLAPSQDPCNIPDDVYQQACIHSIEEALERSNTIGFPIMLKASWGGGGKGIRRCMNEEDVKLAFRAVQNEVPGSPIFAMKLASTSRHVEVQLLCDQYGNCCSLFSRDCSVQRRHQKIVEEGPVTKASAEVLQHMERSARALAKSVGYVGAATVEYLYDINTAEYFFLELNPRLQVEHPVTEWITNVNIPACQLLIGMGVALHRIPDIRRLFGKDAQDALSPIDFEVDPQVPPNGHVVAVRITCEDANDKFKPTCGTVDELSFRPSPEVWGYFSIKSGGGIHSFSDSQFGHLFAKGSSREAAIRALVVALKEIKIRGEIRTIVDYAIEMIQSPEFVGNHIHTGWLDYRVAAQIRAELPAWHLGVIAGALLRTLDEVACLSADYLGYLEKGQLPPARLTLTQFKHSFVLERVKYVVDVVRTAPQGFRLLLGGTWVDVVARKLNDGGLLIQVDGRAHVVHSEEEAVGTRLTIDGLTCLLANETDPSQLLSVSPGKLMRFVVEDGSHIVKNQVYAEIEVMKMMMALLAPADGVVRFQVLEGSILSAGDLVARLELDDAGAVQEITEREGGWPADLGPPLVQSLEIHHNFKNAFAAAENILQGFEHSVDTVMEDLLSCFNNSGLALMQWNEVFSVVENRLPGELAGRLRQCMTQYEECLWSGSDEEISHGSQDSLASLSTSSYTPGARRFPSKQLLKLMHHDIQAESLHEKTALESQLDPLIRVARAHENGRQEYIRMIIRQLFESFLHVEERFAGTDFEATEQEVIDSMRTVKEYSANLGEVVDIVVSHQGLPLKVALIVRLMDAVVVPAPDAFRPQLLRFVRLGKGCTEVAARAQQLLEQSLFSEIRASILKCMTGGSDQMLELPDMDVHGIDVPVPGKRRMSSSDYLHSDPKSKMLIETQAAVEESLASLLGINDSNLLKTMLKTYISRIYYPFIVREPDIGNSNGCDWAVWLYSPYRPDSAGTSVRLGLALLLPSFDFLPETLNSIEDILYGSALCDTDRGTLHIVITRDDTEFSDAGSEQGSVDRNELLNAMQARVVLSVQTYKEQLLSAGYKSISVLVTRGSLMPLRVGFNQVEGAYTQAPFGSSVEPISADVLELERLQGHQRTIKHSSSMDRQCHTFVVTETAGARAPPLTRVFSRTSLRQLKKPGLLVASYKGDATGMATAAMEEVEKPLVKCLNELERHALAFADPSSKPEWTHVLLSVLPPLPLGQLKDETRIVLALKAACTGIMNRYGAALRRALVAQVEIRMRVSDVGGAWRMVVSSPSGHEIGEENVQIYRESTEAPVSYISKHAKSEEQGSLHGMPADTPYPPLDSLQRKRLAAKRQRTTYCYDFPSVFNTALRELWAARSARGEPGVMPAGRLVEAEELTMSSDGTFDAPGTMFPVTRPIGSNDVGVVAWLLTLKTPECPQGRQVVAVANDITYNGGSFSPQEDAVFRSATEYALEERLPMVYLAANSGARVGLAEEVKQCLQVEWADPEDPTKGFKYLYLKDDDYQRLWRRADRSVVKASSLRVDDEVRWVLKHVIGMEDGLGVECLSGSGSIASTYSRAFAEGLTITYVTSRTVGIGAYLARLGRRCIQRIDQPIILTGYAALNKLLGRQVYSSQLQLGGPKVMGVNGVSHSIVRDDLEGATSILLWISTMPPVIGMPPCLLQSSDPVDRPIGYCPAPGEKLDPRAAIAGRPHDPDASSATEPWLSGLFDRGTWQEANPGWARSVVTGRARLDGNPVGVIAVETATTTLNIPADPGAPDTAERNISQSGQVWYPNSALKTAHAIEEFDLEGLPLFILANWRGFSGGQRDLFDGVLQTGSLIVEHLRRYKQPVFVYIPPGAELRGGAWVVIDGQINPQQIEMYADSTARGGVLEPEGIVEIKFRTPDLLAAMHRIDPQLKQLSANKARNTLAIKKREQALLPVYRQVAVAFAEMHDTPVRMVAKGVLNGIVPWSRARLYLATRLRRRLAEEEIVKHIITTDASISRLEALQMFRSWFINDDEYTPPESPQAPITPSAVCNALNACGSCEPLQRNGSISRASSTGLEPRQWDDDHGFLSWVEGAGTYVIANALKELRIQAASRAVTTLTSSSEGREGFLQGLKPALAGDGALRAQLATVLYRTMTNSERIRGIPEAATPRRFRRAGTGSISEMSSEDMSHVRATTPAELTQNNIARSLATPGASRPSILANGLN